MIKRVLFGVIVYLLFCAILVLVMRSIGEADNSMVFFFGWLLGIASSVYAIYLLKDRDR